VTVVETTLNGRRARVEVEPNQLLIDLLREDLGLTSVKQSCEVQVCGSCTVLLDGDPVSSCCLLAADIEGRRVETLEGMLGTPLHDRLAASFLRHAAVQCGFCTAGMILTAKALAGRGDLDLSDESVLREAMSGNLCRCTGYQSILEALTEVFAEGLER